jgi:hypothetical protein
MLVLDGVEYLVEKEASARYGRSVHWFRKARSTGKNVPYHKLNGKVYYSSEGLDRWFKENLKPILL